MKKVFSLLAVFLISGTLYSQTQKDTLIVRENGEITVNLVSQETLSKIKLTGVSPYEFSDQEVYEMLEGKSIPRYNSLAHMPLFKNYCFGFSEVSEKNDYRISNGIISGPEAKKILIDGKTNYIFTSIICLIILMTVKFIVGDLKNSQKHAKIKYFIFATIIFPIGGLLFSALFNWILLSSGALNSGLSSFLIALFSFLPGAVAAIYLIFIICMATEEKRFGADLIIAISNCFAASIFTGMAVSSGYGIFSSLMRGLWIYLGIYTAICLISFGLRKILIFYGDKYLENAISGS